MCGRFGLANPHRLKAAGALDAVLPDVVSDEARSLLEPRFNIAPTQPVVAARVRPARSGDPGGRAAPRRAERRVDVLRWGLIPSWAKEPAIGGRLANARAETLGEKPSFRGAWRAGRRCLVFADLFYEWQDAAEATADPRDGDAPGEPGALGEPSGEVGRRPVARAPKPRKQPFAIRLTDDAPFAFGGLWEVWRDPGAEADDPAAWVPTCTLITTAPNTLMRPIHDRMPVIVPRAQYDRWLDPERPLAEAETLLAPYAPEAMRAYPVSTAVNAPRHDDPHVLDPLPQDALTSGDPGE